MSYTVGGATSSGIELVLPNALIGSPVNLLVSGWFRLTSWGLNNTLVWFGDNSGRWGVDNVTSTTMQMVYRVSPSSSNNTVRVANAFSASAQWQHITWFTSVTNANMYAGVTAVWIGTPDTPPQEYTVTTVSATGGLTPVTNTTTQIGATGGGASTFAGDVAGVTYMASTDTAAGTNFFGLAPGTTLTTEIKERLLSTIVYPLWRGDYSRALHPDRRQSVKSTTGVGEGFIMHMPLKGSPQAVGIQNGTLNGTATPTGTAVPTVSVVQDNPRPTPPDLYHVYTNRASNRRMR